MFIYFTYNHTDYNIKLIQRFSYDDGLFQRFFLVAPTYITAEEIRSTPRTILGLHCIFYFLDLVNIISNS